MTLRVIGRGVGAITQDDVNLAIASDAVIIGFNVRPAERAGELARREGVEDRRHPDPLALGAQQRADRAEPHRAPHAEAAVPDVEDLPRALARAEVEVVVGGHVVEPTADEAERHGPDGDGRDELAVPPAETLPSRGLPAVPSATGDGEEEDPEAPLRTREGASTICSPAVALAAGCGVVAAGVRGGEYDSPGSCSSR